MTHIFLPSAQPARIMDQRHPESEKLNARLQRMFLDDRGRYQPVSGEVRC